MGSGVRDITATMASRAILLVSGLALQSCLAWFLEPAGRGAFAVCMIYTTLLAVICTFGVDGAGQYFVAAKKLSLSEVVSTTSGLLAIGMILAIVAGLLLLLLPLEFLRKASSTAMVLAIVCAPWQMASSGLLLIVAAKGEFPFQALMSCVLAVLRLIATVVFVRFIGLGVEGAIGAYLLALAAVDVGMVVFLRRRHGLHWVRPKWNHTKQLLHYGVRYYPAAFSTLVNVQVGTIMVAFFASQEDIGYFHAAVTLTTYVVLIGDVVGAVIHPRIAVVPSGRPELAAQSGRLVGVLGGLVLLVLVVFARPIVAVLLSPKFMPVVPLIWILAPMVLFRAITKVLGHYLNATNHPGALSASTITSMLLNFAFLLLLLPTMGLQGAAWAMSIGYFCGGVIVLVAFWRTSGMSFVRTWAPQRSDIVLLAGIFTNLRHTLRRWKRAADSSLCGRENR